MRFYKLTTAGHHWGDYFDMLVHGMARRVGRKAGIESDGAIHSTDVAPVRRAACSGGSPSRNVIVWVGRHQLSSCTQGADRQVRLAPLGSVRYATAQVSSGRRA
jgi:hypothetical protein